MAEAFSPRYERHRDDVVVIDVSGLDRLLGPPRLVGDELRRDAANRGLRVHVAVAATRMAALVLAYARPGVTVVDAGHEASALAPLPIRILEQIDHHDEGTQPSSRQRRYDAPRRSSSSQQTTSGGGSSQSPQTTAGHYRIRPPKLERKDSANAAVSALQQWGLKTLGELAALPAADLRARLGPEGLRWQAMARGEDIRPLVPHCADERFTSSIELDWPIEGAEPLSFVLTRLLEPLSTRLERRDRGAAALHVHLRLITKEWHARRLQLPSPLRDVRTLRTLALLDLESHPPPAAIDHVAITIDPTPGCVVQHTLFTRAVPTPDRLATLLARLGALMGQDRIGRPATIDSYRPGGFTMKPFATDQGDHRKARRALDGTDRDNDDDHRRARGDLNRQNTVVSSNHDDHHREHGAMSGKFSANTAGAAVDSIGDDSLASVIAVCDPESGGFLESSAFSASSAVDRSAARSTVISALRRCRQPVPARVMVDGDERPSRVTTDRRGFAGGSVIRCAGPWRTSGEWWQAETGTDTPDGPGGADRAGEMSGAGEAGRAGGAGGAGRPGATGGWNRDEWDVALSDGAVYRIFRDRVSAGWFIDAIVD